MASAVEIKIEPIDDEYPVIKQEELIIKTEIEDPTYNTFGQVQSYGLHDSIVTFIPKEEPIEEHRSTAEIEAPICNTFNQVQSYELHNSIETLIPKEEPIEEEEASDLHINNIPQPCATYFLGNQLVNAYRCIDCKDEFTNYKLLVENLCSRCYLVKKTQKCGKSGQTHSNEKEDACNKNQCKACDRVFLTQTDLQDHLHLRCRAPMNCPECKQVFRTKLFLNQHIQTHLNKKKKTPPKKKPLQFFCHNCNIKFTDAKLLQTHYFLHGFICGHKCVHCGQHFKYNHGLRNHIDSNACSKVFSEDVAQKLSDETDIQIKEEDVDVVDDTFPMQAESSKQITPATQNTIPIKKPVVYIPLTKKISQYQTQNQYHNNPMIIKPDSFSILQHISPQLPITPVPAINTKPIATTPRIVPIVNHQSNSTTGSQNLNSVICKLTVGKHNVITDRQGNTFILQKNLPPVRSVGIPKIIRVPKGGKFLLFKNDNTNRFITPKGYQRRNVVVTKPLEPEVPTPTDSMDTLLEELFDRKAQSKRKAAGQLENRPPIDVDPKQSVKTTVIEEIQSNQRDMAPIKIYQPNNGKQIQKVTTDFEDVIATTHLIIKDEPLEDIDVISETEDIYNRKCPSAETISNETEKDKDCTLQMSFDDPEDFENIIVSNMLPNIQMKDEVIKDLTEEYLKAKKKNSDKNDEVITDESSHSTNPAAPQSIYRTLKGSKNSYSTKVQECRYRYYWVCLYCPRRYLQRHSFVKHLETHSEANVNDDKKLYELRPELYTSMKSADTYCHLCRVELADLESLAKHKKELHRKQEVVTKAQYQCVKCGKFCSSRSTLMDHLNADCGTKPQYGCDTCGKKFYTNSTLNLHKTMHTGILPYECGFCKKRFRTRGQLTVHTRTHTGERPFPCKVCERRFTHRETLISHLSRHIDMKRYKCTGCEKMFSSISGLKNHRSSRMATCGKFKFSARPVGPRVRVIKGNVIFEPQPKINPYFREDEPDDNSKDNGSLKENENNQEFIDTMKMETIDSNF